MKYAVIRSGGKQYQVSEGDVIAVEKLLNDGKGVTFKEVLLYTEDGEVRVGAPTLSDVYITGKILEEKKGEKIRVAKYKAKSRYRRVTGHRQIMSMVQIESISNVKKVVKKEAVSEKPAPKRTRTKKATAVA